MKLFRPSALSTVAVIAAVGLAIGAGVASAHVVVNPGTVVAGSYPTLTFTVPNESAKADTVKFTVNFPMDHPFASIAIKKESGWTGVPTTTTLATPISDDDNASITQSVSSITWTADAAGKIALGEFATFDISVGPVPKVPSVAFTALQSYSDGSIVRWDGVTPASGAAPEHPAPLLTITLTPQSAIAAPAAAADNAAADNAARTLGAIGIVIGAFGLLAAAVALRRRPRIT